MGLVFDWIATGPLFAVAEDSQLVINTGITIVAAPMVFLIQNPRNRAAAALQTKCDELVRAIDTARGGIIGIEHLTDREVAATLAELKWECGSRRDPLSHPAFVSRLPERVGRRTP